MCRWLLADFSPTWISSEMFECWARHETIPLFGPPPYILWNTQHPWPRLLNACGEEWCLKYLTTRIAWLTRNQNRCQSEQCTGAKGLNRSSASSALWAFCQLKIPPQISSTSSGSSNTSAEDHSPLRTSPCTQRFMFTILRITTILHDGSDCTHLIDGETGAQEGCTASEWQTMALNSNVPSSKSIPFPPHHIASWSLVLGAVRGTGTSREKRIRMIIQL